MGWLHTEAGVRSLLAGMLSPSARCVALVDELIRKGRSVHALSGAQADVAMPRPIWSVGLRRSVEGLAKVILARAPGDESQIPGHI